MIFSPGVGVLIFPALPRGKDGDDPFENPASCSGEEDECRFFSAVLFPKRLPENNIPAFRKLAIPLSEKVRTAAETAFSSESVSQRGRRSVRKNKEEGDSSGNRFREKKNDGKIISGSCSGQIPILD